jgi:hypothetical protein
MGGMYDDMFNNMGAFGGAGGSIPYDGPSAPPVQPGMAPPPPPSAETIALRGEQGPELPARPGAQRPMAPPPPEEAGYLRDMADIKAVAGGVVGPAFSPVKKASTAEIDRDVANARAGANQRARGETANAAIDTELSRNIDISNQARQAGLQQDIKAEAEAAARLQQRLADHTAMMAKSRDEFLAESKAMNPYKRFTDGTANTIFSSLALVLGSAGDALTHSDKFAKQWNSELDREFEVQKQRLNDKRFVMSDQAQQFYRITAGAKSEAEAKDRWKAAQTQAFTQHIDTLRQQADGKKVQGRLDGVLGALKQEEAKFDLGAHEKTYASHVQENIQDSTQRNAGNRQYAGDVNKRGDLMVGLAGSMYTADAKRAGKGGVTVPGYNNPDTGEPLVFDPKEAEGEHGIRARARNVSDIKSRVSSLRALIEESNNPALPTTVQRSLKKRGELLARGIASLYSQINGAGAPISEEIKDAFASFGEDGWYGNTTSVVNELEQAIDSGEKEFARGHANPQRNVWDARPTAAKK